MTLETNTHKTIRSILLIVFKIILVAGIFSIIARRMDIHAMGTRIAATSIIPLTIALCLFFLNRVLTAIKWDLLLQHNGVKAGLLRLVRIMFESGFIGLAIPSGLGPDIVRLIQIRTHNHDITAATSSVLADRILSILVLAGLSGISTIACMGIIEDKSILIGVMLCSSCLILIIMGMMTSYSFRIYANIHDLIFRSAKKKDTSTDREKFHQKFRDKVEEIHTSFNSLLKRPSLFGSILALNIMVQVIRVAQVCLLFIALGADVPLASVAAFYPMILLIKLLPFVPFMGIGVQEGAFVYFFHAVGVMPETALPASILNHIIVIIGLLPGAAMLLMGNRNIRSRKHTPQKKP
ncbi:MAG: flippase-like domain-containing protein [Kiritimatiellae bacterium]|nr:flippase-like domain-containing protein [Kiritimatiellia bacterium]